MDVRNVTTFSSSFLVGLLLILLSPMTSLFSLIALTLINLTLTLTVLTLTLETRDQRPNPPWHCVDGGAGFSLLSMRGGKELKRLQRGGLDKPVGENIARQGG